MKVSFRNNSFDAFNINKVQTTNNNQTNTTATVVKEDKPSVSFAGVSGITPAGAGGIIGTLIAIAGAIKFRKNIGTFIKKIIEPTVEETVKEVKPRVKKLYNDIQDDLWEKLQKEAHERYIRTDYGFYPSGTLFVGPDCKAKEKAVEDLVKFLEEQGWNIERMPLFEPPKAQDVKAFHDYCGNYRDLLVYAFIRSSKLRDESGQKTAFVMRGLDKIVESNSTICDWFLNAAESAEKEGITFVTDAKSIAEGVLADKRQFIRTQRIDKKLWFRPLQEDSKEVWETYLSQWDNVCQQDMAWCLEKPTRTPNDYTRWYMQDAIDKFPEQYRESSELYQKLKDTQYYPFEF